jgi:hypothetical protein
MENLNKITHTKGGYPIKDIRFKKMDNLIVGLVQDPVCGNPNLHDGYISCVWRRNGKVEPRYGKGRDDLEIDIKLTL